ncbi:MAG TPA: succinylglutamate desuccinylase [Bacteroidetes bacterium]|nr:succinylglutamate desuccinylase [Bacteroidota bacterium]
MMTALKNGNPHIIGEYEGHEKGPLLICMAGMHGNEPAGVEALKIIFHLLEKEPVSNPDFFFKGKIVGLLGNVEAYKRGQRNTVKDLNRQWTPENIKRILDNRQNGLHSEDKEMKELLATLKEAVESYRPDSIVLLDLHTTSAHGGIFAIATDDPESIRIAVELHAPVITGMLRGIHGTTLHFFSKENFNILDALKMADENGLDNSGKPPFDLSGTAITGVAFEAGQHDDPLSVNRCIAAIINCMRSIGIVSSNDVENRHDVLLQEYSKDLPKIAELIEVHHIGPLDEFKMLPGYKNFQPVHRGEALAKDRHGIIQSTEDGLILMPLYQPQGSDGFFLIKEVNGGAVVSDQ